MSDDDDKVTINFEGLDQLLKALKQDPPVARVGILGSHAQRTEGGGPTNAEIGAAHEFGTSRLPVRSFLRLPISALLQKRLEAGGAFDEEALRRVLQQASFTPWVEKMAITAVGICLEAFDSGGMGTWVPSNMARKKVHQTLVETGQLRGAITYDVKETG